MGVGRVLETDSLLQSLKNRGDQYKDLETEFTTLKTAFQQIVNLDDFKGMGAKAIKDFYEAQIDVVNSWLELIELQRVFLDDVPNLLEDYELNEENFIQSDFLEDDLKTAQNQVKGIVGDQQDSLETILDSISDIVSLDTFSLDSFNEEMQHSDEKREETLELLEGLDQGLLGEYSQSIPAQEATYALFSELLNATAQGGEIQPINFDVHAYKNSEAHDLKKAAADTKAEYLDYKEEQQEVREARAEAERIENLAWYEKGWEYASTFVGELTGYYDYQRAKDGIDPLTGEKLSVADRTKHGTFAVAGFIPVVGWAGRALKGGKAIHSTAKGAKALDTSLSAYQYGKSMDTLRKTEYGIYGLASANGFSEYITGKDMFGNELSEEKRSQSLNEALFVLGASGMGMYADRLIAKNSVYAKPPSGNAPTSGMMNHINQSISQGINNLNSMIHGPKLAHEFAGSGTNFTVSSFKDTLQRINKVQPKGSGGAPPLRTVNYGDHITRGRWGRHELKPNVKYVNQDGYKYRTDEYGRIVEVEANQLVLKEGVRNKYAQRKVGGKDRLPDDDGGHLIATQFNGPGDIGNLVPQNSQINRSGGEWYNMEQIWVNALNGQPPREVSVKITPVYPEDSFRPDFFEVMYKIKGQETEIRTILNRRGG